MNTKVQFAATSQKISARMAGSDTTADVKYEDTQPVSGPPGASAYEVAVKNGFEGTEEEWLESLKGEPGKDGIDGKTPVKGIDYFDGVDGKDGYTPVKGIDYFDGKDGQPGKDGSPGADGEDGFSPVVAVSDIDGGHRVTITDKDGEHSFDVMDGGNAPSAPANSYVFTGTYSSTADASGDYPATLGEGYSYADMLAAINANYDVRCVLWRENGDRPIFLIPSRNNFAGRVTFIGFSDTKQVYRLSLIEDQVKVSLRILTMADGDDLDSVWEAVEAFEERIVTLENSLSVYSWSFSFTDKGDGTYEVTGGNDYEAILEAYSNGYRVELLTEDGDHRYMFTLAEIGAECIVFTSPEFEVRHDADGSWQMTNIGTVHWDDVEGKPFGEEVVTTVEPLNIQWDGNTDGLLDVDGSGWYKVSDYVFSDEDIKKMRITWGSLDGEWMENPTFGEYWDGIVGMGAATEDFVAFHSELCVAFVRKKNTHIEFFEPTFPETGVYFYKSDYMRTCSLTSEEPVTKTKTVERIDVNYLPEALQFGEEVVTTVEPLNITWDGNTEGLPCVDNAFYRVSDDVFSSEDIKKMRVVGIEAGGTQLEYVLANLWDSIHTGDDGVWLVGEPWFLFVRKENAYIDWIGLSFPLPGVYFFNQGDNRTSSLTSDEPVTRTKIVVHTVEPKYLPMDDITAAVLAALPIYNGEVEEV